MLCGISYTGEWDWQRAANLFQKGVVQLDGTGDLLAIENAIGYFQSALEWVDYRTHPELWEAIHRCLGDAFLRRMVGDPAHNARCACEHFRLATLLLPTD